MQLHPVKNARALPPQATNSLCLTHPVASKMRRCALKLCAVMNYIAHIPAGTVIGFKALPLRSPELQCETGAESLWGGLYPQLSFQSAMDYLPNQWDMGCKDGRMADVEVSSVEKAESVAQAAKELLGLAVDCKRGSIVRQLGEGGVCLCIMDADDFELVLPHALAAQLEMEVLFTFRQSDKMPGVTGAVEGRNVCKSVLEDVAQLGGELGIEVCDSKCLHVRAMLGLGTQRA
jgi:hypothetical protein